MARWMRGAAWLGYVLNTVSDIAGMVLTYWYGRLQQDRSTRKRSLARLLLVAEGVAVLYSWFFSWRQLLIVLPAVEGDNTRWVAPIAAGFIPLLLAFIGYAQALLAGRIEAQQVTQQERNTIPVPQPVTEQINHGVVRTVTQTQPAQNYETTKEHITALLRNDPQQRTATVAKQANCSETYVRKVRNELQEA
jgi:hypothetical protein